MEATVLLPVLLSGKQGSGKTSITAAIHAILETRDCHVFTDKFARTLYEMHDAVLAVARRYGIPVQKKEGRLLQVIGTDWGREIHGEDVWTNCAVARYQQIRKDVGAGVFGGDNRRAVFLIDDLRFRNEMQAFHNLGALTFRLEAAREVRKARADAWREDDTHQSEVDLDDSLDLFTRVYRTDGEATVMDIAASIVGRIEAY